jgi:hypothetical protein
MCKREAGEVVTLLQFHEAVGVGDELVPQVLLGKRIIEAWSIDIPISAPRRREFDMRAFAAALVIVRSNTHADVKE